MQNNSVIHQHINSQAYLHPSQAFCNPSSTGTRGSHGDQVEEMLQGRQPFYAAKWMNCKLGEKWSTDF